MGAVAGDERGGYVGAFSEEGGVDGEEGEFSEGVEGED